jgi:hypothetical protein
MYGDPATVVERIDAKRPVRPERGEPVRAKRSYGLVSDATRRLINKARIQALVRMVRAEQGE